MNKAAIPFAITLIVVVAMIGAWMVSQQSTGGFSASRSEPAPAKREVINITSDQFQSEVLEAQEPVLVDFFAVWCGPCHTQAKVLKLYAARGRNAKIVKIDVDKSPDLSKKFEITAIPTLLVFKNGQLTQRHTGLADAKTIDKLLE